MNHPALRLTMMLFGICGLWATTSAILFARDLSNMGPEIMPGYGWFLLGCLWLASLTMVGLPSYLMLKEDQSRRR